MDDYPSNSRFIKGDGEPKKTVRKTENETEAEASAKGPVRPVTRRAATRKSASLGRKFMRTFFEGVTSKELVDKIIFDVIIPDARAMIYEAGQRALEQTIFGESRSRPRRSSFTRPTTNGYTSYSNRYQQSKHSDEPRTISHRTRRNHEIDDILVDTNEEGVEVLNQMFELIDAYGVVTVADFYGLVRISDTPPDHAWGWKGLGNSDVVPDRRGGFRIILPKPIPLNQERG